MSNCAGHSAVSLRNLSISSTSSRQAEVAFAGGAKVASASLGARPANESRILPAHPVGYVLRPAQYGKHVLDVRRLDEFEAAELDEGNIAPGQLDFQHGAVMRGAEQDRLLFQRGSVLTIAQHGLDDEIHLADVVTCSAPAFAALRNAPGVRPVSRLNARLKAATES